eukprot:CAMPEP_0184527252 /NCGR_PEP_ID=MMETSP0198_2-20121128/11095_1 /TAXON_ID=1112570 /ORGANISM="Thraustochytrium sp., Strain LLF1b" /LENGTH=770 /DNA_ID=CAMNT_0026918891 /DNA_START=112 /DNA_END=2424 /DNA_ORIENTATION=-
MRVAGALAGLVALGSAAAAHGQADTQCPAELFIVLDSSGSMAKSDPECLEILREDRPEDGYNPSKPCWSLYIEQARKAYKLVNQACKAANADGPMVSLTTFRCPNTGKDHKVWLEPTEDTELILEGFERIYNQAVTGYSCATGALEKVASWVTEHREARSSYYDPIVLAVTDGALNDKSKSYSTANNIVENGALLIASAPFLSNNDRDRLEPLTVGRKDLVLDATDPDSLKAISLQIGPLQVNLGDFSVCSETQNQCILRQAALLNESETCGTLENMYESIASCAASGCTGLDLTEYKNACLEGTSGGLLCDLNCDEIAHHINAQNYGAQPVDESDGYYSDAATPGTLASRNWIFESNVSTPYTTGWMVPAKGSIATPMVANDGSIIAVSASEQGISQVRSIDTSTGETKWTFEGSSSEIVAQPVQGEDIFVGDMSGTLFRLDATDGSAKGHWNLGPGRINAAAAVPGTEGYLLAAVASAPGLAPAMLHKLKLDASNKEQRRAWKRSICPLTSAGSEEGTSENTGAVESVILLENLGILVACKHGIVERYSLVNGLKQWDVSVGSKISRAPTIDQEAGYAYLVVLDDDENFLVKVDLLGELTWKVSLPSSPADVSPTMDFVQGTVHVVLSNASILTYSALDGQVIGEPLQLPGSETPSVGFVQSSNRILVSSQGSSVHFIDLDSLEILNSVNASSWITASPVLVDGSVFVTTVDSTLEKFSQSEDFSARRVLLQEDAAAWPPLAVGLTVFFTIVLVMLLIYIRYLFERAD